ncbi:Ig-like domain-containing protein [Tenacibaculum ovolyticum]|uniref:Ig-like domain-containing protein n=1 Tax=Tenacibaculum ovolyticum TaxID=104270 RepID=UPI003BAC78C6
MNFLNKKWKFLTYCVFTVFFPLTLSAQVTLYDQSTGVQSFSGPSSQIFTDLGGIALYAADDFEIPNGKSWSITQIKAFGKKDAGNLGGSVTVNIFSADPSTGLPTDNIVYTQVITPTSAVTDPNIDLAIPSGNPLYLNGGKYWLNVLVSSTVSGRWYWSYNSTGYSNDYYLKDPPSITGGAIPTSWTVSTGIPGYSFDSHMAFKLTGTSTNTPSITSTAVTSVNDNATYNYTVTTSDPDTDSVTLTATIKPIWLSFNGVLLTGSAVGQAGDHNVTLKADDGNGGIVTQSFTITVTDVTAPVFDNSTPSVESIAGTSFTLNTDINEGGTIYYVVVANGASAPTSAEVKAGTASGGGVAIKNANAVVNSGGFTNAFSVTGLTSETAYDVYVVAEDDAGSPNLQASPTKVDASTAYSTPQEVDFNGFTGSNLATVFPGWGEASGEPKPLGASSQWINSTTTQTTFFGKTTAKINLYTTNRKEWLVSPPVVVAATDVLTYKVAVTNFNSGTADTMGSDDSVKVMISTDNGNTWTMVKEFTTTDALSNSLTEQSMSLSTYAGQAIQVAFYAQDGPIDNSEDYDFHVADIFIGTPDATAPVFENSTPSVASIAGTSFTLNTDINEGGTIYYVIVVNGASVPTSAEIKAGTASGGGVAIKSANAVVNSGGFTNAFSVTGLTSETAYDVYVVAEDDAGSPNLQTSPTKVDVTTADVTAPRITSIVRQTPTASPTNADAVIFRITFDENVQNVNSPDFIMTGASGVSIGVTGSNTTYDITLSGGDLAIVNSTITLGFAGGQNIADTSGNALTNLTPTGTNSNTFVLDNNGPTLTSSNPTDDATGVVLNQDVTLTFNENISKGTGNILIKKASDNSTIETIDVTTASVTVSTNTATINPSTDFDLNTGYYIQIANTAFNDVLNNNYAGITDATSLNFTSEANQTNAYAVASGNWSVPSNWSLGRLPISSDNVNLSTNTINLDISNVTVNDLSISIGGSFNILSGQSITVEGNLNQNGTLNILSNASNNGSLIVKGNHTGISNVDYHRYLSTNWHLIASPVAGKNISDFTGNLNTSGNKYSIAPYQNNVVSASRWNYYTTAAGVNNIATAGTFTIGKGYSIQKSTGGTLNFSGTLNTTDKTFAITDGGDDPAGNRWNLVGNPFTASLNGSNAAAATNNFLKVNIDAGNLDPSRAGLYLWNGTVYVEKSVDDAAFYIAPGQGFFVHAPDAGGTSVSFTEAMETHQTGNVFLRGSGKSYPEIVLNINEGKNSSSTKIRYINNKTKGLDPGSDVGTFTGTNASFKVFSHLIDNNKGIDFAIQALPNQDYESTIIPIGLKAKAGKAVVFSAEVSNLPNGIEMYLEDRVNNTFTNLSKEDYTITLKTDTNSIGQFYIHTSAKNLEAIDVKQNLESVSIYKSANNTLTIAGLQTDKALVNVYSILGQKVISTALKSSGSHVIELPKAATGVYIVELNSNLGKISKKIILE